MMNTPAYDCQLDESVLTSAEASQASLHVAGGAELPASRRGLRLPDISAKEYCSTKEAAQRLGLSLGTVQQMVESGVLEGWKTAGGHRRIRVTSVERFVARSVTGPSVGSRRGGGESLSIIVAESDPIIQARYRSAFDDWGFPIDLRVLSSGFELLLELGRNPPDLLITDLHLPGMDGFEMIRCVRESRVASETDIVAISAFTAEELAGRGGLPQDVTFYAKPVPVWELRGYVQALVSRRVRLRRA